MSRRDAATLARLAALAGLQRDAELGKLAAVAQSRARLQQAVAALATPEATLDAGDSDPGLLAARLRHRRWSEAQLRRLNQQLALISADWLRQRPAAAKAFGRAAVLDGLARRTWRERG